MRTPFRPPSCGILLALAACGGDPSPAPELDPTQRPVDTVGDPELPQAPPRQKIGNLTGIGHDSRIVFASYPERPHVLEVSFTFPDRARSLLRPEGARSAQRALSYRFGQRVWSISPGQKESEELPPARASEAVLEFELRRALFLWPEGFEWKETESKRMSADVVPFGHLEAVFADDSPDQPVRMEAFDAEGQVRESFRDVSWVPGPDRPHPATFEVYLRGSLVWTEEVLDVDLTSRYLDTWYIPADEREPVRGQAVRTCSPIQLDALVFERHELEPGMDLTLSIQRAESLAARSAYKVSSSPHVELAADGQPRAVWLVLSESDGPTPPVGWQVLEGGPATSRFLPEPRVTRQDLRELAEASAKPPRALFLRVQAEGGAQRRAELVSVAPLPGPENSPPR